MSLRGISWIGQVATHKSKAKGRPPLSQSPKSVTVRVVMVRRRGEEAELESMLVSRPNATQLRGTIAGRDGREHQVQSSRWRVPASNRLSCPGFQLRRDPGR